MQFLTGAIRRFYMNALKSGSGLVLLTIDKKKRDMAKPVKKLEAGIYTINALFTISDY